MACGDGMWGLFPGIGLGILQVFLLRKTVSMMLGAQGNGAVTAVVITLVKLAAIMGVFLWLTFSFGIETLLWAAGAMVAVMIGLTVFLNLRKLIKEKKGGEE